MKLAMMPPAERHGELIANFEANRTRLGKAKMMRIARLPTADQTWLRSHKFQLCLVSQSLALRNVC
jgi:hypothetical protein